MYLVDSNVLFPFSSLDCLHGQTWLPNGSALALAFALAFTTRLSEFCSYTRPDQTASTHIHAPLRSLSPAFEEFRSQYDYEMTNMDMQWVCPATSSFGMDAAALA